MRRPCGHVKEPIHCPSHGVPVAALEDHLRKVVTIAWREIRSGSVSASSEFARSTTLCPASRASRAWVARRVAIMASASSKPRARRSASAGRSALPASAASIGNRDGVGRRRGWRRRIQAYSSTGCAPRIARFERERRDRDRVDGRRGQHQRGGLAVSGTVPLVSPNAQASVAPRGTPAAPTRRTVTWKDLLAERRCARRGR